MSTTQLTKSAVQGAGADAAAAATRAETLAAVGFLLLRVTLGVVFALHGWQKLSMMGIEGVGGFFGALGIPAPMIAAALVTGLELVGGVALILGVGTRVVGALLAVNMATALLLVHLPNGFFVDAGGFEFVLVLGAAALFFALAGGGRYAVDAWLRRGK